MSRLSVDARWQQLQTVVQACAEPGQPAPLFAALDRALATMVGHKLFTLMILDHGTGEAERVYTNEPEAYPVSGRKQMAETPWFRQVIIGRAHYLGPTRDDIRWAFFDHELIERLGCRSAINVLVIHDDQIIGTANLLHQEHHYSADDIDDCLPFAQLLVPAFQALIASK